jgi:UDP-N-acetylmuramoyl-L-alanyl-D-glutamate--2,6-diaminopimelate ligase
MKMTQVLEGVEIRSPYNRERDITSICFDSRAAKENSLFVCMKWMNIDSHLFARAAYENGAQVIIAEDPIDLPECEIIYVEDSKEAFAKIAANFYGRPAEKLKLVGVTGTKGKTSITYFIKSILDYSGRKTGLIGTNQNLIGNETVVSHNTTPFASELHALFSQMVEAGVEYTVMEVASHALELKRVAGLNFEVAGFTNLTQDHLDFHHDMENYFMSKKKIMPMAKKVLVNKDDPYGMRLLEEFPEKTISYSCKDKNAEYFADHIHLAQRGVIFDLCYHGESHEIKLQIPGGFSVYNALCAAAMCLELGIGIDEVTKGLMLVRGVMGRAEVVPVNTDYTVIIDYAHTPDSLKNIISTVREFAKGRVITLFGCGGDRDRLKRPIMGRIAGELSDFCVVTSDNPRTEDPHAIIEEILVGVRESGGEYKEVDNRKEAIGYALSIAQKDDVIILAGKGHETYQILGKTKIDFDERKIVREFLSV